MEYLAALKYQKCNIPVELGFPKQAQRVFLITVIQRILKTSLLASGRDFNTQVNSDPAIVSIWKMLPDLQKTTMLISYLITISFNFHPSRYSYNCFPVGKIHTSGENQNLRYTGLNKGTKNKKKTR